MDEEKTLGLIRASFVRWQGMNTLLAELAAIRFWILPLVLDFACLALLVQFRTHAVGGFRLSLGWQALK